MHLPSFLSASSKLTSTTLNLIPLIISLKTFAELDELIVKLYDHKGREMPSEDPGDEPDLPRPWVNDVDGVYTSSFNPHAT